MHGGSTRLLTCKREKEQDMKRLTMLSLCLAVMIAVPAVVSASASAALPEFSGPFPKPFKVTSGALLAETVNKVQARCKAGTNSGEITGPQTGGATLKLTGCEVFGLKCSSAGAAPGEIVSNLLSATLGYINKAKKEVGISLESATGGAVAEFSCGSVHIRETGSVIGKLTPVNKEVAAGKPFSLKFTQKKGKQKPTKFEGGPVDVLMASVNGGTPEEAGLAVKGELTFAELVEIKA
jgi:hypothetical protein